MSDQFVLSIDPGLSSGVALGKFSDTKPYSLVDGWQFDRGVQGMIDWLYTHLEHDPDFAGGGRWDFGMREGPYIKYLEHGRLDWVCERFVPLAGRGFSLTVDAMEPVAIEGALMALGIIDRNDPTRMKRANEQYFVGGKTKPEKRKRLKRFLKATDNYRFGKDLGAPDNEDFVSAVAHGISYVMRVLHHKPTFEQVSDWSAKND